jgi:formamidopyrimidine-DNA glycosylase
MVWVSVTCDTFAHTNLELITVPEGPEVKRITERINDFFQDTTLESIEVVVPRYGEKQLRGEVAEFQSALPLQIESVQCKGKFIYFTLENGWTVWNTLGMSGTWRKNKVKHTMLTFHTSAGKMHYKDMRRFGTFRFCSSTDEFEKKLSSLGPDILAEDISDETFMYCMRRYPNRTVVQSLMDQKVLAGVGNYIKAEALYRACISPHRVNSSLTDEELVRLNQETKWVIRASYASRGARISTYELPDGSTGTYNFKFLVYRRKTDPAGLRVVREQTRDKRTTHWVPERQH